VKESSKVFSTCVLCDFPYVIGLDVHLFHTLHTEISFHFVKYSPKKFHTEDDDLNETCTCTMSGVRKTLDLTRQLPL
jgi:hypothetical protein